MQPSWRVNNADDQAPQEEGDWGELHCSGANGMLSVVAAVFFWGRAIQATRHVGAMRATWDEALQDVSYVLKQLLG